jgi:uncharacterized protein YpuA (DUF1002 family)
VLPESCLALALFIVREHFSVSKFRALTPLLIACCRVAIYIREKKRQERKEQLEKIMKELKEKKAESMQKFDALVAAQMEQLQDLKLKEELQTKVAAMKQSMPVNLPEEAKNRVDAVRQKFLKTKQTQPPTEDSSTQQ